MSACIDMGVAGAHGVRGLNNVGRMYDLSQGIGGVYSVGRNIVLNTEDQSLNVWKMPSRTSAIGRTPKGFIDSGASMP